MFLFIYSSICIRLRFNVYLDFHIQSFVLCVCVCVCVCVYLFTFSLFFVLCSFYIFMYLSIYLIPFHIFLYLCIYLLSNVFTIHFYFFFIYLQNIYSFIREPKFLLIFLLSYLGLIYYEYKLIQYIYKYLFTY